MKLIDIIKIRGCYEETKTLACDRTAWRSLTILRPALWQNTKQYVLYRVTQMFLVHSCKDKKPFQRLEH